MRVPAVAARSQWSVEKTQETAGTIKVLIEW
jgi:hypothetical protein